MFFVVPGNGQGLLRMPDMAALNIINLNIDSVQVEVAECKTNIGQETQTVSKGCTDMAAGDHTTQNANGQNSQTTTNKSINYFFSLDNADADKRKSSVKMQKIHDTFGNVFNGIGCFEGTFSLQLKPDSKPYQVPPRHVVYMLQKPFKEELECLQKMDIITPLGVDGMAEWCNSYVLVPKAGRFSPGTDLGNCRSTGRSNLIYNSNTSLSEAEITTGCHRIGGRSHYRHSPHPVRT